MKSFAFLALIASAVVVASFRVWDCPVCGRPPAPVNCPYCRDACRVSSWTRLRLRSDPCLRVLFESPRAPGSPEFARALSALLQRQGAPSPLLRPPYVGEVRFDVCDGEDVILVLVQGSRAGLLRTEAWMLDLRGTLRDRFDTLMTAHDGSVVARFERGGKALHLWADSSGVRGAAKSITLRQDGRPLLVVEGSGLGLRLAGGKFERVLP